MQSHVLIPDCYVQLETFERVKEKISSTSTPFSLARQRLQRANTGLNGRGSGASKPEASLQGEAEGSGEAATPRSPFQSGLTSSSSTTPDRTRVSPLRSRMLVASPVVDLSPPKQTSGAPLPKQSPVTPVATRGPPARQISVKAPLNPPMSHPAFSALNSSKQQAEPQQASGQAGEGAVGAPLTPERLPSGRMLSGRLPSGLSMNGGEPGQNLKPISTTRSLTRGRLPHPTLFHSCA